MTPGDPPERVARAHPVGGGLLGLSRSARRAVRSERLAVASATSTSPSRAVRLPRSVLPSPSRASRAPPRSSPAVPPEFDEERRSDVEAACSSEPEARCSSEPPEWLAPTAWPLAGEAGGPGLRVPRPVSDGACDGAGAAGSSCDGAGAAAGPGVSAGRSGSSGRPAGALSPAGSAAGAGCTVAASPEPAESPLSGSAVGSGFEPPASLGATAPEPDSVSCARSLGRASPVRALIAGARWLVPGAVVAVDRRGTTAAADPDVGHLRRRRGRRSRRGDALAIRLQRPRPGATALVATTAAVIAAHARGGTQRRARQLAMDPLGAAQRAVAAERERADGELVSLEMRLQR